MNLGQELNEVLLIYLVEYEQKQLASRNVSMLTRVMQMVAR